MTLCWLRQSNFQPQPTRKTDWIDRFPLHRQGHLALYRSVNFAAIHDIHSIRAESRSLSVILSFSTQICTQKEVKINQRRPPEDFVLFDCSSREPVMEACNSRRLASCCAALTLILFELQPETWRLGLAVCLSVMGACTWRFAAMKGGPAQVNGCPVRVSRCVGVDTAD